MAHVFLLQIGNHRLEINRPNGDEYTPKIMMREQ